ncbi:MAG: hypothetical protein HWN69_06420 [Desulfobacterales bacterium]|nr:hypothetical protein [Desulfobacterales bacterium]
MYKIEWQPKAFRQLNKVRERKTRVMIFNAVDKLQNWPDCRNVKAVQSTGGYRLRVGNWRILFDVKTALEIIEIEEVKKRNERTY